MLGTFPPLVRSIVIALVSTSLAVALMGATPSSFGSSTLVIFPFRVAGGELLRRYWASVVPY